MNRSVNARYAYSTAPPLRPAPALRPVAWPSSSNSTSAPVATSACSRPAADSTKSVTAAGSSSECMVRCLRPARARSCRAQGVLQCARVPARDARRSETTAWLPTRGRSCSLRKMANSAESPAAPSASRQRVPDFFIVGSPKTGTTALYHMLRGHPQIFLPDLKEPRFLASDMHPLPKYARDAREFDYPATLEQYLALFDGATPEQRAGEASVFYLWSRTAADRIAELQPDARIIAILREPASLLRSLHLMFLRWSVESEQDLGKAVPLEQARRNGKSIPRLSHRPQLLQYSEHVRYVDQLA